MSHPLIVTERRLLPRLFDTLLTLIAGIGFIWLIYQGVVSILQTQQEDEINLLRPTFTTLAIYLLIVLVNSLFLILWAKYNQLRFRVERRTRRPDISDDQLATHFGLSPEVLAQLNQSQIAVVNYDNDGAVVDVNVKR
ncbi:MAG: poly-beta-1,6-N-acetyl-D-glucosamine biosynthesis protein PgaD [Pseudomonas sp.]|nr:poly-beta-1,6-N-acetyl-D-glucosamine biosynthesis protein PgaD [Pseudomonas sp.]